jgi:hypothetical protein
MLRFGLFLAEEAGKGILSDKIGTKNGDRHFGKYLSQDAFNKHGGTFEFRKDALEHGYKKGDKIQASDIIQKGGRYHIRHTDSTGTVRDIPASTFYKPSVGGRVGKDQEKAEAAQVDDIQKSIDKARGDSPYARLHTGNGKFINVAGIRRVDKDFANATGYKGPKPKADAYFVDHNGHPVHHISLKDAQGFQQLGGTQDQMQLDGSHHPVVQGLIDKARDYAHKSGFLGKELPEKGSQYHMDLDQNDPNHRNVIHRAMYGRGFGGDYGINNVNSIVQGGLDFVPSKTADPERKNHKGIPTLDMSGHIYNNNNDDTSDRVDSKILVTKRDGVNQEGTGGRIMVLPKDSRGYINSISYDDATGDTKKDKEIITAKQAALKLLNKQKKAELKASGGVAPQNKPKAPAPTPVAAPAPMRPPSGGFGQNRGEGPVEFPPADHKQYASGQHGGVSFNGPGE